MSQNGLVPQQRERLTRKQAKFVEAQLAGANLTVSATTAGVSFSTAKRWQRLPVIDEALRDGEKALFNAALDELMRLVPKALQTLEKHMAADCEPTAATQLHAARALLEQAIDVHKLTEIEEGLKELEARLDEHR